MEEEATQPGSLNHLNLTSSSPLCSSPQRSPSPTPPCTPVLAPHRQFSPSAEIPDSQDIEEYWLESQECSLVETPSVEMRDEIPDSQEYEEDLLDFSERSPVETSSAIMRDEIPDSQEAEEDWLDSPESSPVETSDVEMQDAISECQQPGDLFKMEYYEPPQDFIDDPYYVATQIITDPRRLGQHTSELDDEDLADVFCILHPASLPAYEAAAIIAEDTPGYTLPINSAEVKINDRKGGSKAPIGTFDLASRGIVSCDIALRLSAKLKDPLGGHVFGRNPSRADFVFGHRSDVKRISNIHFRIYINEHGIIMLEDQSTNGTAVDGILLRAKEKENGHHYRQTLQHGSIITITMTPPDEDYKFIVRIPSRDEYDDDAYQTNLTDYFIRRNHHVAEKKLKAGVNKREPLNLFPTHSSISVRREWKGGPKYNKIGGIGKGAFAVVYKITSKFDGVPYAAKELEKRRFMKNGVLDQKVDSEMKIMQRIHHPNVVKFIEHIDWDEHLYIIMEFVPGGDLGSLIAEKGRLPEWMVKTLAIQLLDALKYLHGLGITHRDVKPDNILISSLEPLHIKLTDFGLSKMVDTETTFMRTFCGTLLYCAPEVYSEYREFDTNGRRTLRGSKTLPRHRYGHAVDIWSSAGVLFYCLSGCPPFHAKNGSNYQELLTYIMKTPLDIRPLQRANISENGIRFVRNMLHVRPEHRATIDELQKYPWLTCDSIETSMDVEDDDDQVDMVGDGFVDDDDEEEDIEKGASQLSLGEAPENDENEDVGSSDITELQQQFEIPSSFNSSEDTSNGHQGIAQPATNGGRLFGEVALSGYASSDAIPLSALNLPHPTAQPLDRHLQSDMAEQSEQSTKKESASLSSMSQSPLDPYEALGVKNGACIGEIEKAFEDLVQKFHPNNNKDPTAKDELLKVTSAYQFLMDHIKASRDQAAAVRSKHRAGAEPPIKAPAASGPMAPPPLPVPTIEAAQNSSDGDRRAERSSSLMGAESMVGHLNMRSASNTPSPAAERLASPSPKPAGSLRRPREDEEGVESWWPSEVPPPKKRNTGRYWDGKVTKQIFWDPKDRTTWHDDYPDMTDSQYQAFKETARAKGEAFSHGNRFFHSAMQSFRSSRSPSLEPQAGDRATSEPTRDNGRPSLLKRDDRKLGEDASAKERRAKDMAMPSTAPGSAVTTMNGSDITLKPAEPIILHDTEGPKRILAHFMATPESQLPTIALPVVGAVTTWGRANSNTIVYPNGLERKIPKLAFKVLLFKPGFYDGNEGEPWKNNGEDKDLAFFISSKASVGIWVNGIHLPRADSREADTNSKFWGELRHGDLVTVWQHDVDPKQFTKFKFECFWGKSKEPRAQPFKQLPQGSMSEEIDRVCLAQEKILREKRERKAAEKKRQKEVGAQDLNRLKHERVVRK